MQVSWHPVSVLWATIALLVLAGALVLAQRQTRRAGVGRRARALFVLRLAGACAVAGYLLRPCVHLSLPGRVPLDLLVLWDRSESMRLAVAGEDSVTRLDAAVGWWQHVQSALDGVPGLRLRHAAFAESVSALRAPVELADSSPGNATDIGAALKQAGSMVPPQGRVLLVSDGCNTSGPSPLEVAGLVPVPVDVVVPWTVEHQADLRIDDFGGRRVVSPGDTAVVRVVLRWEAFARPESVLVSLTRDGVPVDSLVFVAEEGWGEREVLLASPLLEQGLSVLRVVARGPPESTTGNNARSLTVEVAQTTQTVALLASAPHPDYGFLRRLLQRDASVSLVGGVLETDGSLAEGGAPLELGKMADLIVVVSSPQGSLPAGFCAQVAAWVGSGAKGLFWIGTIPVECQSLAELLPVEVLGRARGLRAVRPAAEAPPHPVLGAAAARWEQVPPLVVDTSAQALPGAVVPLVSSQERLPVLVLTSGVAGRVAWMNAHTFWRWFLGDDGTAALAGALVERLVGWLGQQGGPVRALFSQVGDAVAVEAQVYDIDWRPWDGCSLELALRDSTGHAVANLEMGAVAGAPGFYRGRTGPLPHGTHRYVLTVRSGETTVFRKQGRVYVQPTTAERADAAPCAGVLRGIAGASGGRYYGLADAADWVATLSLQGIRRVSVCPWRGGWWALVALLLLSGEWYLRRRIGLS